MTKCSPGGTPPDELVHIPARQKGFLPTSCSSEGTPSDELVYVPARREGFLPASLGIQGNGSGHVASGVLTQKLTEEDVQARGRGVDLLGSGGQGGGSMGYLEGERREEKLSVIRGMWRGDVCGQTRKRW
ncbi:uncharacterized protein PGTG_19545 [Puccinia graminis f. sp. tritici CRL 75-36-700-3]|uniref:Uncharacterized protein n=1 Tax=Puccinia graminis f. sp. tritici (strain CRL 75-36-700-3 / race SCCL) TaxID=418459 RepID=E3LAH4_PUCGT|nr:uncharacterized protein PGTG_19545 [Puccinia graminis f. sp. tritici CRL 75-36-700-3]EFP93549.1 hypothetical protein PGTG_19545 [Puccinia graminis f. sp. tritici CRL 75-36-700-3]